MPHKVRSEEREDTSYATEPWTQLLGMQGDIEATMFVVMMEAAKSAREDLKAIMAGVKAVNAAKCHQRELIAKINRDVVAAMVADAEGKQIEFSPQGCGKSGYERTRVAIPDPEAPEGVRFADVSLIDGEVTSRRQLEAAKDALQGDLDSMSELGEMESLRLQMAMDRYSKMMSTLSNILKKVSETSDAITQNIK
jgi:hypothetical protein